MPGEKAQVLKDSARMQLLSQKAKALYLFFETDSQSIDKVVSTWQYNIGKVEYEAEHTHTHSYVSGLERRVHALEQALLATKPGVELEDIIPPDHDILRQQLSSVIIGEDTVVDVESPFTADVTSGNSTPDLLSTGLHGFDWGEREPGSFGVSDGCQQEREGSIGYFGKLTNVALLRMLYKTDLLWGGPSQRHDDSPSARLVDEGSTTIAWEDLMPPQGTQWFTEFFINAYFNYFHTTYPLLHEPTFRAQFSELLPRPPEEAWSLLTRAVLALGAWCTGFDITVGSRKGPPDYFALFRNINLFESGSLCMVQALTLLGTFLHKQCKFNSSSIYLGAAVKMALSLGLHREFSHCDISLLDREMRRRVWWCLYILDSGAAMTMGRPILLPSLSAIGIKKPLNVPEQCVTARTSVEPEESRGLTIYSNLIAQVEFHMLANKTYNAFVSNPEVSIQGLLNFEDKVEAWCRSLPPHLQEDWPQHGPCPNLGFSSSHLLWRVRCIKAALFFPTFMEVVRKSRTQPTAPPLRDDQREVLCISVRQAHDSVNDIHHFFLKESLDGLRNWYARYCLVQNALVLTIALRSDFVFLKNRQDEFLADLGIVKDLLTRIVSHDAVAEQTLGIIHAVLAGAEQSATDSCLALADGSLLDLGSFSFEQQFNSQYCTSWNDGEICYPTRSDGEAGRHAPASWLPRQGHSNHNG